MRKFLGGLVYGGAFAALGLGTASYLVPGRVSLAPAVAPAPAPAPLVEPAAPASASPAPAADPAPATTGAAKTEAATPEAATSDAAPVADAAKVQPEPTPEAAAPATGAKTEATPAQGGAKTEAAPAQGGAKTEAAPTSSDTPVPLDAPVSSDAPATAPAATAPAADTAVPAPAADAPAATAPAADAQTSAAQTSAAPPLQAFAAAFDGSAGKPLFSIVLLDASNPNVDRAVAASLPFPVTFAIDPESPDAAIAMAIYRAAGKEVVMMPLSLPSGGAASDIETSFAAYQTMLPEAVAVMSAPEAGFQDQRDLASLVVPVIGAQGRGVLLFDKGLNSAGQIAQREGIPYAAISKVFDEAGASVPVMRRFLDRLVFKAAQDGAAVVMGTLQPDTLTALTEWSLEGRASDVTLAPISALMQP